MPSNRLAGHTLPSEGRIFDEHGYWAVTGPIRCSCGEESPVLPNDNQRRKWHRAHKAKVRHDQEAESAVNQPRQETS